MGALKNPSCWRYTPEWRAEMWRSQTFGIHARLDLWHPRAREGEWYHVGYTRNDRWIRDDNIVEGWSGGAYDSWRRGIWTGGRHEAEARIRHHRWAWSD